MSLRDRFRLSDRFRGKLADKLIDEITKEFENNKRSLFDPDGSRFRLFRREGFPFDSNVFNRKSDAEIKSHFEDLTTKKHPEFVDDLHSSPWSSSLDKNWERAYTVPISLEKCEDVEAETAFSSQSRYSCSKNCSQSESPKKFDQRSLRHTVDITEHIQKADQPNLANEPKRSSSAPLGPTCNINKEPLRFTSKIEITPVNPFEPKLHSMSSNESSAILPISDDSRTRTSSDTPVYFFTVQPPSNSASDHVGQSQPSISLISGATSHDGSLSNQVEKSPTSECHSPHIESNQPQVRHIPIFVEGRAEPVVSENEQVSIEQGFFISDQVPLKRKLDGSDALGVATFEMNAFFEPNSASPEKKIPVEATITATTVATVSSTPTNTTTNSQSPLAPTTSTPFSAPVFPPPSLCEPNSQQCVQSIQQEVNDLTRRVEKYCGTSRNDKEYLYLDEMFTRYLIKLDTIEVDGNEQLRAARKHVITLIQNSIALLERKVPLVDMSSEDQRCCDPPEPMKNAPP